MRYFAWILSFCVGFISLGQEMLWFRIISFEGLGTPQAFSYVLTHFLLGIAVGAYIGKTICDRAAQHIVVIGGIILFISGLYDLSIPFLYSWVVPYIGYQNIGGLIFLSALFKATIFPVAHHMGTLHIKIGVGVSVSRVYFFNIIGSTLGTILIGGLLLEFFTTTTLFMALGISTLILSLSMISSFCPRYSCWFTLPILGLLLFGATTIHYDRYLIFRGSMFPDLVHFIEGRQGIIQTIKGFSGHDTVYGGKVYDGMMNIDVVTNPNHLDRVLLMSILHPEPKRALVIGLSGGAWTRVLSSFPTLDQIDVVEINGSYLKLIEKYPEISPILTDPKINIYIDDGRRWLKRNPNKRYDLIVMNTTYYWRSGTTNLLSVEMMKILHNALTDDGIVAFNSTRLPDALKTAKAVFPYAYWGTLAITYASKKDFSIRPHDAYERLKALRLNDVALFPDDNPNSKLAMKQIINTKLKTIEQVEAENNRPLEVITDRNMIPEYKLSPKDIY